MLISSEAERQTIVAKESSAWNLNSEENIQMAILHSCLLELPQTLIAKGQIVKKYKRKPIQTAEVAGRGLKFDLSDRFANLQCM